MSKFTGIHIKTLRYYEEIGVLIPEYVGPEANYRYYSINKSLLLWRCILFRAR
ncbi:MerR family DNA-binding transcriptional regulator [Paenibacillus anaericanus]|uniref:MerR family DNA-binding transcriptional regulator n=2 Tax=Paenibacillus anaericanus TaxID=170367 RepID=A0A3S1C1U4_9BACL|nr:MerR family DNA-binding transcriptional regulator [Paenibacillus anaericanus]